MFTRKHLLLRLTIPFEFRSAYVFAQARAAECTFCIAR